MPSVKYNPIKKHKSGKTISNRMSNIVPKSKFKNVFKYSVKLIIILVILGIAFLTVRYFINNNNTKQIVNVSNINTTPTNFYDGFDTSKVPSGNIMEGFVDPTTTQPISFENLTKSEQEAKCLAISQDILGFRNKLSGATFRFQKVDKFSNIEEYHLLGEIDNGRVVQAQQDTSLKYSIKDSSNPTQIFVKKNNNNGDEVYFTSKAYPDYALQYEHDHLSLRTHNNSPYEGQKFIKLNDNDKVLKDSISFGIGKPHLAQDDLQTQGPRTFVFVDNDGNTRTESNVSQLVNQSQSALDNLTQEQLKEVVGNVLRDYNQYKIAEQQRTSSMFSDKPLQFNVNLGSSTSSDSVDVEGFRNIRKNTSDLEHFENLKNGNNSSNDVRTLLNRYSQQNASFGNNNLAGISNNVVNRLTTSGDEYVDKLQQAASGTSFKGCPRIDRKQYVTGRQVARCYGCNPDASLQ